MAGATNLTALSTNLGAYCRESSDKIFADMLLGLDEPLSKLGITVLDNIKDEFVLPNLMVGSLVKPGNYTTFAPNTGALVFGNRTMKVRPFKIDLEIFPQEYEPTWLTHIRKSKGTYNAENFPFYEFLVNKIIEKAKEELRYALFTGVYNPAGTTNLAIMDGLLKLIADDVTATNIVEVTTGAITAANALQKIEDTVEGLGESYKTKPGYCVVSSTIFKWYIKSTESTVGRSMGFNELSGGTNQPGQSRVYIRGTNIELVPEYTLGSSQRIIASTSENIFMGTDTMAEYNNIEVQRFNRGIKLLVDGKIGLQYGLANATHRAISVNDQV